MDWHERFVQQAGWTEPLRRYLFGRAGLDGAARVLEAGCGTGAILASLRGPAALSGMDRDAARLKEARRHAPQARLVCADVLALPYASATFDITFCHYLLLWVSDPLQALREMKRVTRPGGSILALAEPDYDARRDEPAALAALGRRQTEALRRQGADVGLGRRLAELFHQAGILIIETSQLQMQEHSPEADAEMEWRVLQADLAGQAEPAEMQRWQAADWQARARGARMLYVPTYWAFGKADGPQGL